MKMMIIFQFSVLVHCYCFTGPKFKTRLSSFKLVLCNLRVYGLQNIGGFYEGHAENLNKMFLWRVNLLKQHTMTNSYTVKTPITLYRRSWNWWKSGGIPKTAVLGVILYNIQNPHLGLENGRRYWEGGGIGRGGIEGDDCIWQ